ncbi:MAG TPA: hypothetical protein VMI33_10710 [Streptosporangiaceae bacterium]|nr:hypothetical protein [Streptosporangiaceae bacterium]
MTARQFDGADSTVPDLRVGEIRALRTFRLSEYGDLNPVAYTAAGPWVDGPNTARCRGRSHTPAAPGCKCGFWAYGSYRGVCDYAEAQRLLAVISCWGRVVPGTRGLRAQHARIEAIWVSGRVSRARVRRLRERYPSVAIYRSRRLMLTRNRPTVLASYEPDPPARRPMRGRPPGRGPQPLRSLVPSRSALPRQSGFPRWKSCPRREPFRLRQSWSLRRAAASPLDVLARLTQPATSLRYPLSARGPMSERVLVGGTRLSVTVAILALCWGLTALTLTAVILHLLWPGAFWA